MAHHNPTSPSADDRRIDVALSVVTHPENFCDRPTVLQTAWQILKEARGQTVDLHRIGPASHRIEAQDSAASLMGMSRQCLDRLRRHAASKRVPVTSTHWPTGGDAA